MPKVVVKDIDGVTHTFVVTEDHPVSIVDIAEENGVELPYSCRSGACFSCCAKIHQGADLLDREKTGEQLIDVDDDEFLCCIGGVGAGSFSPGEQGVIELEMLN